MSLVSLSPHCSSLRGANFTFQNVSVILLRPWLAEPAGIVVQHTDTMLANIVACRFANLQPYILAYIFAHRLANRLAYILATICQRFSYLKY